MGPGLALVLALLAQPVRAERAVGLDAKGVDPMAALRNPNGLDVRDQHGRPVSAELIRSELKQAQTKAAVQAAFASALPKAAEITALFEMLEVLRLAIAASLPLSLPQRLYALAPSGRAGPKTPLRAAALVAFALLTAACRRRHALSPSTGRFSAPSVLRC